MRFRHVVGPVAAGLLVACCSSCKIDIGVSGGASAQGQQNNVPLQVIDWPVELFKHGPNGVPQVGECGLTDSGIYCLSVLPEVLETWKWDGTTLGRDLRLDFPGPRQLVFLPNGVYLGCLSFHKAGGEGPLVLGALATKQVIMQREQVPGWVFRKTGSSRNRKFVAVGLDEDVGSPPADFKWDRRRVRVALVDAPTLGIRMVGELPADHGFVGELAVSDDGEYIALAGYSDNGVALLSVSLQKVLWNQRLPEEVRSDYVVFSSDGSTLYAGGTMACVYAIETKTGKVKGRWYATMTGKSIYGHRIACLAMSPDDRWVAAGTGTEGQVYLVDVTSPGKPRMLVHRLGIVEIVSFSPDSQYLASFAGGKIKIWSVASAPRKPPPAKQLK